jgi:hypothetical protein
MNTVILIGLNALALVFMFGFFNRKIEKRLESGNLLENVRREIQGIILELNKTTDRNIGLIEERVASLKEFIESADKRIMLINREAEKHELSTQVYNMLRKKSRLPTEDQPQGEGVPRRPVSYEEVMNLYNKGISAGLIANKLGTTIGEVELVISLQAGKGKG